MWLGKIYFANPQIFCKDNWRTGKFFGWRHLSYELIEKTPKTSKHVHKMWVFRQDHVYFPKPHASLLCGISWKVFAKIWDESKKIMLWEIHSSDVKCQNVQKVVIFVQFVSFCTILCGFMHVLKFLSFESYDIKCQNVQNGWFFV